VLLEGVPVPVQIAAHPLNPDHFDAIDVAELARGTAAMPALGRPLENSLRKSLEKYSS